MKGIKKTIICVTGTPGTGKTELSSIISIKTGLKHLDLNKKAKSLKLIIGYDKERGVNIVDESLLTKKVRELSKKSKYGLIVDSHISHFTSSKIVDLCIICRCELKELKKRLKKRAYTTRKIRENIEAEIFNICGEESAEMGHKTVEIDCSSRTARNRKLKTILKEIKDIIKENYKK